MDDEIQWKGPRIVPDLSNSTSEDFLEQMPDDDALQKMLGVQSTQAARGLIGSAVLGLGESASAFRSLVLSMGAELQPNDAIESMLVIQLAITHVAMMRSSAAASEATSCEVRDSYDRITNRLGRTFTTQIETLRKYRSSATRTVRVEHVNVNAGGKAIVGSIKYGGEADENRR